MRSSPIKLALLGVLFALCLPALANEPASAAPGAPPATPSVAQPLFQDAAIETRLNHLSRELRCVVCQNESLAESPAELANAMREEIRELMRAGKTDAEVLGFLTARYGDFVLFRPPFKPLTYLLWLGPFLFLGFGALVWYVALRARRTFKSEPVSSAQLAAAARLLEDKP